MSKANPLTPMCPFTAWKYGETFPAMFVLLDVWENPDGIVTWLRVGSSGDSECVTAGIAMAYAGLARPQSVVFEGTDDYGRKVYSVELNYGS